MTGRQCRRQADAGSALARRRRSQRLDPMALSLRARRPGERDPARAAARPARAPRAPDHAGPRAALLPRRAARRTSSSATCTRRTSFRSRRGPARGELRARRRSSTSMAAAGLPCVLAGDFNLRRPLRELALVGARAGIDHILVRGRRARRRSRCGRTSDAVHNGAVLSDHAPVEVTDRMTPEEGRALFPVLERLAYLNAGTFGPLARPTADAVQAAARRRSRARAASARSTSSGCSSCATQARARARRRSSAPSRSTIALTGSTTDGCNIVLAGLDLQPEDEIVTTDRGALRAARAGARERRPRRRRSTPIRRRSSPP